MMAAGPESGLLCLPTENLVSIYGSCGDMRDAQSLGATCRRLQGVLAAHENVIARAHILRALGPSDFRLGVMAVASRGVDPRDRGAIEQFLARYLQRPAADWPASNFSSEVAVALPRLIRAADALADCAFHWFTKTALHVSPTEHARKVRTAFMIETAANLFYRVLDGSGSGGCNTATTLLWRAPFTDLETAFWEAFSFGEIWQAYEMRNPLASFVSEGECQVFREGPVLRCVARTFSNGFAK